MYNISSVLLSNCAKNNNKNIQWEVLVVKMIYRWMKKPKEEKNTRTQTTILYNILNKEKATLKSLHINSLGEWAAVAKDLVWP